MTNNPDLPQFSDGGGGWAEIRSAYELAPYTLQVPVAIQTLTPTGRTLNTGVIASTSDEYIKDEDDPWRSFIWFQGVADPFTIDWGKVQGVIAMVALPPDPPADAPS